MSAIGKQYAVDDDPAVQIVEGRYATVTNQDATNSVFLGGASVSAATGYELKPGDVIEVDGRLDSVWAICAATKTARVDVLAVRRAN